MALPPARSSSSSSGRPEQWQLAHKLAVPAIALIHACARAGLTQNSSSTLMHIVQSSEGTVNPPVAVLVGDHCYAGA